MASTAPDTIAVADSSAVGSATRRARTFRVAAARAAVLRRATVLVAGVETSRFVVARFVARFAAPRFTARVATPVVTRVPRAPCVPVLAIVMLLVAPRGVRIRGGPA